MPSLYIHIPFCEKKCVYCDFYSIETLSPMEDFLRALHNEIDMYAALGKGRTFDTVFLGGGTPSLLSPNQLASILNHLAGTFPFSPDAEITTEINPGTMSREKLRAYKSLGVNRISMGVQSFHDDDLKFLSRIHSAGVATRCIETVKEAGFENFSIDLMYALPHQTRERWKQNLERAVSLTPPHISAYGLIVEEGTPLARMVQHGQVLPAADNEEAELYEMTMEFLGRNGYEHYEVSNYAKPGFRSRHNDNYWHHGEYLGFGPSAHSFWNVDGVPTRWWNIANLSHYNERLQRNEKPLVSSERLTRENLQMERVFLGLRSDGLDLGTLRKEFPGFTLSADDHLVRQLVNEQLAILEHESLRLTAKGYVVCDEICVRLSGMQSKTA